MNKQKNSSENNKKSEKIITNRKSFLEELAYCPDSSENFEIKKYYISPDELEDIINISNDNEKEPEI